jgi:aminopeptidase YwaD
MSVRTPRGSLSEPNIEVTPYSGGSDHMMFIDRKIPSMMIGHSDYTHHTSEDTPDKVDPVELERSEIIATASLLYLSDLTEREALDLVLLVGANGAERLGAAARRAQRLMNEMPDTGPYQAFNEARSLVTHAADWEKQAISSILYFQDTPNVRAAVEATQSRIEEQQVELIAALRQRATLPRGVAPAERTEPADDRVPVRTTRGPLDFGLPASQLSAGEAAWYSTREFGLSGNARFELVNFVDGERTVTEIRDALSAEYGPVAIGTVGRYLDDLVKVGVMRWT